MHVMIRSLLTSSASFSLENFPPSTGLLLCTALKLRSARANSQSGFFRTYNGRWLRCNSNSFRTLVLVPKLGNGGSRRATRQIHGAKELTLNELVYASEKKRVPLLTLPVSLQFIIIHGDFRYGVVTTTTESSGSSPANDISINRCAFKANL